MAATTLGAVVVGLGIAGRVRVKDILEQQQLPQDQQALQAVQLIGYVSRRQQDIEGAKSLTYEEAISRDDVQCIIICTENETHEDLARRAITVGKHVLVEFPLATSCAAAKSLLQLAQDKGVVCHEEDIALLLPAEIALKQEMKTRKLKQARHDLKGRINRWIGDFERSGPPFTSSISQIHRLLWACGDVTAKDAYVQRGDVIKAHAELATQDNRSLFIDICRDPNFQGRSSTFSYEFEDGTVIDSNNAQQFVKSEEGVSKPGLFLQDLIMFVQRVRGEMPKAQADHLEWMTVRGLELADRLYDLAKASPQSAYL